MIDKATEQRIKDAANVKDVISEFYTLKRDGSAGFTCLCPFHEDRHIGSFKVSEARNYYKCFSCGESGGPVDFLMKHENMSYPDALRRLGAKYGIEVEGADSWKDKVKECTPHEPPKPLPMIAFSQEMVDVLKSRNKDNTFCNWVRSLPWDDDQKRRVEKMINNYQIGHTKEGHAVFWQIDEHGIVHTGKMMKYKADGHRDKVSEHNFDWVHSVLLRAGQWNYETHEARTCYFGQHLINCLPHATINLVESEKTALICAIAYGNMWNNLWIATGGKQFFKRDKLQSLIDANRTIVVYPDKDGIEEWKAIVKHIGYDRMIVNDAFFKTYWRPEDGPKADIADIILRMMQGKKADTLSTMCNMNPALGQLVDTFNLTQI